MALIYYREERILVRGLCRLPNQTPEDFKNKVRRLRTHFERFNLDVSEICQWLMGLRPRGKRGSDATTPFWNFFLEPETSPPSEIGGDRRRKLLFDSIISANPADERLFCAELLASAKAVAAIQPTKTTEKLLTRLASMNPAHRQVLLKAAAEWVVMRYQKGIDNWSRQREEWQKEKDAWEGEHPELTEDVRAKFGGIFKELAVRAKRTRCCPWERLKENKDNCEYAGVRIKKINHNGFCKKYLDFVKKNNKPPRKKFFGENADFYLKLRGQYPGKQKEWVLTEFNKLHPEARWFADLWDAYLKHMGIKESTILKNKTGLPHCLKFDDAGCSHNKHTDNCELYRTKLDNMPELQEFEKLYREWRRYFLAGPAKPSFRYPSSRILPMPKIFGSGFFRVNFAKSEIELRLDDMPEGTFERFAFQGWPKGYTPRPTEGGISSVQVNFIGTRVRVGFRFGVAHANSRLNIGQERIDELRSRRFPRERQDQEFLDEARKLLLAKYSGDAETELKVLAIDLGENGAGAAVFTGRKYSKFIPLKIIKRGKLYEQREKVGKDDPDREKKMEKGLGKEHLGKHLKEWSEKASVIAKKRGAEEEKLGEADLRGASLHMRWMIRDWARLNAAQIMKEAVENKVDLIVFESTRGFRAPGYDKTTNDNPRKKLDRAFFAYGKVRRKVAEKAVELGMRVVTVPYKESSQHCGGCGKKQENHGLLIKNKLDKRKFICEHCKVEAGSEENAAKVIARVFWGDIVLPSVSRR